MNLRISTWNIRGGASFGWNKIRTESGVANKIIKKDVVDSIIGTKSDVMVLTEFVVVKGIDYLFEQFAEKGYIWFMSNCSGKNGILIAVKENLIDCKKFINTVYNYKTEWKAEPVSSVLDGCNILKIELPLKGCGNLIVVGCRMETGGIHKDLKLQYDAQRKVFDEVLMPVLKYTRDDCKYIVCGDFNNGKCYGSLKYKFNAKDYKDKKNKDKAHVNYNLNIIKDAFENIGFEIVDDEENGIPTHIKIDKNTGNVYEYPIDHIFVKGFVPVKCRAELHDDLSDHYILIGDVESSQQL